MKNKLLLLSAALFGVVSFGNYAHSMNPERNTCFNRLHEIWKASSILINKKLNTTKEDFDFICQKDPSIIYQGAVIFINHTKTLCFSELISTVEFMQLNEFVISNIVQRIETNHEGLAKLNNALPIFSELKNEFSSDNKQYSIFAPLLDQLSPILKFNQFYNKPEEFYKILDSLPTNVLKYSHEINTIQYAIKYDDMNSIIKMSIQPNFDFYSTSYEPNFNFGSISFDKMSFLDFSALHGNEQAFKFFLLNDLFIIDTTSKYAIIGGNNEIVRLCIQQNNFPRFNCLKMSVVFHRYDLANWLMQNYNNHDKIDLYSIIKYGNIPMLFKIIQDKSNPLYDLNKTYGGTSPIHMCCDLNQKEMAEILLIDNLADINDIEMWTNKKPIDYAHTDEMRELLRQYGAN